MFDFNTETGLIRAYGVIGNFVEGISELDFMGAFDAMGGRDVTIQLQSEGGDILAGLSIRNQIEAYSGRVEVVIDALAGSIATVFPMAADRVEAKKFSKLIVHNPWAKVAGGADQLREHADVLEGFGNDIADIYAAKSGKARDFWLLTMERETVFSPESAVEAGLIDAVSGEESKISDRQAVAMLAPAFPKLQMNVARKKLEIRRLAPQHAKA